jgi:uncharacterized UBP type Zn finger protein
MKQGCEHIQSCNDVFDKPNSYVCEACKRNGSNWIALRMCLTCGHVGCCDSSDGLHARKHFDSTKHPVMIEVPNKSWKWCYEHNQYG